MQRCVCVCGCMYAECGLMDVCIVCMDTSVLSVCVCGCKCA